MTQALYRKYRPKGWDAVIGQGHVVQTLMNAIRAGRVGHAYLFAGPRGTGKTTVARLLAKAVNCLEGEAARRPCNLCENCLAVNENRFLDLIEIDAASNTGVDDVRDLREKINFSPSQGSYKIYIIDEVHMLSNQAFNALLKTLEEPPPYAIFILATTEINKIPATVLSRCQRYEFRRVPVDEIVANLRQIALAENLVVEEEALTLIARQSAGGMRDAQSLLDQLSSTGDTVTLAVTQTVLGTATSKTVLDVINAIVAQEPGQGFEIIHRALDAGADARSLTRQIVEYLRGVMLVQLGNDSQVEVPRDLKAQMEIHARQFSPTEVLRMVKIFNGAAVDSRMNWQPSLGIELALAEVADLSRNPRLDTSQEAETVKPSKEIRKAGQALPQMAEPAAPKKEVVKPAGSESPILNVGEVLKVWKSMVAGLPRSQANLSALLNSVRGIEVQGTTLVLNMSSEILVSKLDKPEQIAVVQKLIKDHFQVDVAVRCVSAPVKGKIPSNVAPDGMVAAALRQGGEVADVD